MWKKISGNWVLRDVTLTVPEGVVAVILGPNGAGKTTLLRTLAGLYRVDRGVIRVAGLEPNAARRRGLLILTPDEPSLYPRLTGLEHLELVERIYRCRWRFKGQAINELGLGRVIERRIEEYSRGMRMKLQLLMSLASCTPVTLLDEPLTGLDIVSVYSAVKLLRLAASEGRSIVLSTHEIWVAEKVADWIIVLDNGRVVAQGWLKEILEESGARNLEEYLTRFVYRVGRLG